MSRMHILPMAAAVLFLAAAASAEPADTAAPDQSLVMSKIDTNNDGSVSLDEANTAAEAKFAKLDTDKEGTLDASELTGIVGPKAMAASNPDKDYTLDKSEYMALVKKTFEAADTDHDGTLTPKELSSEEGRALVSLLAY